MNDRAQPEVTDGTLENSAFFMPFSMNRQFKKNPRLLSRAEGIYYFTPEGRKIIDGTSGLWCVNAGHCRPQIVAAVRDQVGTMDYAPPFQMGHPAGFELAARLTAVAPGDLDRQDRPPVLGDGELGEREVVVPGEELAVGLAEAVAEGWGEVGPADQSERRVKDQGDPQVEAAPARR